jgi:hypothetical protein
VQGDVAVPGGGVEQLGGVALVQAALGGQQGGVHTPADQAALLLPGQVVLSGVGGEAPVAAAGGQVGGQVSGQANGQGQWAGECRVQVSRACVPWGSRQGAP